MTDLEHNEESREGRGGGRQDRRWWWRRELAVRDNGAHSSELSAQF